jgi:hypothetical protein
VMREVAVILMIAAGFLGAFAPSPGTPGEGGGEGSASIQDLKSQIQNAENPHPNPLPEYRERGQDGQAQRQSAVGFKAIDVFIDSREQPLAAYQFELKVTAGDVKLVGVEGGEHAAFQSPPYYDPKALAQQRIVVAAFNTSSELPRGRTRVARLMVQVRGAVTPAYEAAIQVAASAEAKEIPAGISVSDTPVSSGSDTSALEGAQR